MAWIEGIRTARRQQEDDYARERARQRRQDAPPVARWLLGAVEAGSLLPPPVTAWATTPGGWGCEYSIGTLHGLFRLWCSENRAVPVSRGSLGRSLGAIGFSHRKSNGVVLWTIPPPAAVLEKVEAYIGVKR